MIRFYFFLLILLLGVELAPPKAFARRSVSASQARRRAHQITQRLRQEDPLVLKWVMQQMGWVPKMKYTRERRKKQQSQQAFDDWYYNMMLDLGGIPKVK